MVVDVKGIVNNSGIVVRNPVKSAAVSGYSLVWKSSDNVSVTGTGTNLSIALPSTGT